MIERFQSLTEYVTSLAGYLRAKEYLVGVDEVVSTLKSFNQIDLGDRRSFILAMQVNFASSSTEWEGFETLVAEFEKEYKKGVDATIKQEKSPSKSKPRSRSPKQYHLEDIKKWLYQQSDRDTINTPFHGIHESLEQRTFAALQDQDSMMLDQVVARLLRKLANRSSRRWLTNQDRGIIDVRTLLRNRFRNGDELARLSFRRVKKEKSKLVFLCDVSRSMELYNRFLRSLIGAMPVYFDHLEVVLFSTGISVWSKERLKDDLWLATPGLWSGGTRIGHSLKLWLDQASDWFDGRTTVIIFSDGWDTGDLEILRHGMYRLQSRSRQVIWLNPTLKSRESREISGMQTAIPYIDVLAPVYNLATLEDLIRVI